MSTSPLLRQLLKKEIEAQEKASQPPNHAPAPATADSVPEIESPEIKNKKGASGSSSHTLNAAWAKLNDGARTFVKGESSETTSLFHDFIVESLEESAKTVVDEAWRRLGESLVLCQGKTVGTQVTDLNYNQEFVRDFVPAGLAFLMKKPAEPEIVKNFLLKTLHLQGQEKMFDNFTLGDSYDSYGGKKAIVAYTKCTGCQTLQERLELQKQMDLTPELCLSDNFDTCGICKDMRWSYHDGGLWPTMLWLRAAAAEGKLLADPAAIIPDQAMPAGNEASHSRKRKRKDDDDPESVKPQSRFCMDPTLPVHVFWCDGLGTATFLGSIEDVQFMRDVLELEIQVHNISHSHNHYNDDHKVYYREWTNQGIIEISIVEPWPQFRRAVRGVILFETPCVLQVMQLSKHCIPAVEPRTARALLFSICCFI